MNLLHLHSDSKDRHFWVPVTAQLRPRLGQFESKCMPPILIIVAINICSMDIGYERSFARNAWMCTSGTSTLEPIVRPCKAVLCRNAQCHNELVCAAKITNKECLSIVLFDAIRVEIGTITTLTQKEPDSCAKLPRLFCSIVERRSMAFLRAFQLLQSKRSSLITNNRNCFSWISLGAHSHSHLHIILLILSFQHTS